MILDVKDPLVLRRLHDRTGDGRFSAFEVVEVYDYDMLLRHWSKQLLSQFETAY